MTRSAVNLSSRMHSPASCALARKAASRSPWDSSHASRALRKIVEARPRSRTCLMASSAKPLRRMLFRLIPRTRKIFSAFFIRSSMAQLSRRHHASRSRMMLLRSTSGRNSPAFSGSRCGRRQCRTASAPAIRLEFISRTGTKRSSSSSLSRAARSSFSIRRKRSASSFCRSS